MCESSKVIYFGEKMILMPNKTDKKHKNLKTSLEDFDTDKE